jgi:16S rRNA (cytosine967-C5)-methyltransferase
LLQKQIGFQVAQLFPWNEALSPEIDPEHFDRSLLQQPNLFLRLRPGREQNVIHALQQQHIPFETITETCIATSNSTKVDALVKLDAEAVVQDRNSQLVLTLLNGQHGLLKKFSAWDCCAASGGKSLLLLDQYPGAQLTVSDVRQNILHNLQVRFKNAGIKNYNAVVANAATDSPPHRQKFDLIICDAPCSGSGTWSRTPEQLHFHSPEKTTAYAQLQKSIVQNVAQYLKPEGLLLYCTCSVFAEENEAVVHFIRENSAVSFLKSTYFKGYGHKADTLFAALFQAL